MKIIVENLAKKRLDDIFYYNLQYSLQNAITTDTNIVQYIQNLEDSPYLGRYIPEMSDQHFREIIYRKTKHSIYRIMYYVSENNNTIHVFNILNCKQDFYRILKSHNYFNFKSKIY